MLQAIRDRATGVFAWVIVTLLIIPFALWGIQEYFGGGSAVNVAVVNDLEIPRTQLNARVDRELRGKKERPEGKALVAFRRKILNQIIQEEILYQSALDRGFRIHEAVIAQQIETNPAFYLDGRFNQERYEAVLASNGFSPGSYQAMLGRDLITQQFVGGILRTSFVLPNQVERVVELEGRKLDLDYLELPLKKYLDHTRVSDEQGKKYYQQHKQNFRSQEQVRLDYLMLSIGDIENELKYTDKQLRQFYDDNQDSFLMPEQRQLAHIMIEVTEGQKEAGIKKARQLANELYQKLQKGADFAKLASQFSDDAGSAKQGGDIGVLEEGTQDKAFEEAALKLKKGEYSKPVKSAYGYHIIKVLNIKPGSNKSFSNARADVEKMYRKQEAEKLFFDKKDELYNLSYENPDSLDVAASGLNLKIKKSPWFGRSGIKGDEIVFDTKVVTIAFSGDVFANGEPARSLNSKLINLKAGDKSQSDTVAVIRLSDYKPSKVLSFEKVKSEISHTLTNQQAVKGMNADMKAYIKLARGGVGLEQIAKEKSVSFKSIGYTGRSDQKYDALLLNAAFKAPKPGEGKISYTSVHTRNGNGAIVAIKGFKTETMKKNDSSRKFIAQFLQRIQGSAELKALLDDLKSQASITIFEGRLASDSEA